MREESPFAPPEQESEEPKSDGKKFNDWFVLGLLLGILLNVFPLIGIQFGLHRVFVFYMGLMQLTYQLPIFFFLRYRGYQRIPMGQVAAMAIVFLINAGIDHMCNAMFRH